jgi:hypothetical protein
VAPVQGFIPCGLVFRCRLNDSGGTEGFEEGRESSMNGEVLVINECAQG